MLASLPVSDPGSAASDVEMTSLPASDPGSAAVWGSKRINPWPQSCLCLTWSGYSSNDDYQKPKKT